MFVFFYTERQRFHMAYKNPIYFYSTRYASDGFSLPTKKIRMQKSLAMFTLFNDFIYLFLLFYSVTVFMSHFNVHKMSHIDVFCAQTLLFSNKT